MTAPDLTLLTAIPLHSARLDLEPLRLDHAPEMAEALADPALHTFIGGAPLPEPALRARYVRLLAGPPDPRSAAWCNWVLRSRENGAAIGTVQATVTPDAAEIAWVLGTAWQHHGLAREAATTLAAWLREQAVPTLVAHIHPDHEASAAVARAAGLEPTDAFEDGERRWEWHGPGQADGWSARHGLSA
ncbi:GNAT family N-acetyltransferase [Streptomyces sp. NPDC004788]